MVLIDTDVLIIHFRYARDTRFQTNSAFLARIKGESPCTTIYNLMEFLGQMSFNESPDRLSKWNGWLRGPLGLFIVWPDAAEQAADGFFREELYDRPFAKMLGAVRGMAFNDSLIIGLAERTPGVDMIVTWNARHFVTETTLKVKTPEEYVNNL